MLLVPIALLELLVFRNCFEELISPMNWQFEVVIEFRESFYEIIIACLSHVTHFLICKRQNTMEDFRSVGIA
jgi:hypothetical protein